jgi:hypothetical protein
MVKIKDIFHTEWSHGEYLDYWSFVHLFSGIILGIFAVMFSSEYFLSFIFIIILLIFYEWIEILLNVAEGFKNILLDVVVGGFGSAIAIFVLPLILSPRNILGVLSLSIVLNLMLVYGGWNNFLHRKAKQGNSYKIIFYTSRFIFVLGICLAIISSFYYFFLS